MVTNPIVYGILPLRGAKTWLSRVVVGFSGLRVTKICPKGLRVVHNERNRNCVDLKVGDGGMSCEVGTRSGSLQ
jgi:hypothetical protein